MGQTLLRGYPTADPVYYVPCEPLEPVIEHQQQQQALGASHQDNSLQQTRSGAYRRMSKRQSIADEVRKASNHFNNDDGHGGGASGKEGDGEWMYNLDTLADEHKKRSKKK